MDFVSNPNGPVYRFNCGIPVRQVTGGSDSVIFPNPFSFMRKLVASLVVAVLVAVLGVPFLAGVTTQDHACCRAHGVHHCADTNPGDEPSFSASCPHHGSAVLFSGAVANLEPPQRATQMASFSIGLNRAAVSSFFLPTLSIGRAPPQSRL